MDALWTASPQSGLFSPMKHPRMNPPKRRHLRDFLGILDAIERADIHPRLALSVSRAAGGGEATVSVTEPGAPTTVVRLSAPPSGPSGPGRIAVDLLPPGGGDPVALVHPGATGDNIGQHLSACCVLSRATMHARLALLIGAIEARWPIAWAWGPWSDEQSLVFVSGSSMCEACFSNHPPWAPMAPTPENVEAARAAILHAASGALASTAYCRAVAAAAAAELGDGHSAQDAAVLRGERIIWDVEDGPPDGPGRLRAVATEHLASLAPRLEQDRARFREEIDGVIGPVAREIALGAEAFQPWDPEPPEWVTVISSTVLGEGGA